jgi:DNA-binding beta-propeller fold protein YncE
MGRTARRPSIARKPAGRTTRAGVVLTAMLASAAAGPGAASAQALLYVASQEDVTVAVIDTRTNDLLETVDLKKFGFAETSKAHDTAVEPDGSYWYVSLIAAGKVLKLDRSNRLVDQVDFETPGMLAVDPTDDRLYVGRSMAAVNPPQRIGVIRRSTMEVEEVDVFFQRPHALAVDPHGRRYFSASLGENSVAYAQLGSEDVDFLRIDGETHVLVQFAVSPDGRWLVGGGQLTGDLLVFDLTDDTPTLVRSVPVGGQPWHPTFTADGSSLWVPNQSAGTVTVVDVAAWTVDEVIHHPALVEPHGSAASPDGRYVYVSSRNVAGDYRPAGGVEGRPGTVVVIDAATRDVVRVIEVGRYAAGMATAPVGEPR